MAIEYLPLASSPEERESEFANQLDLEPTKKAPDRFFVASIIAALVSSIIALILHLRSPLLAPSTTPQPTLRANSYMHFDRFLPEIATSAPMLHSFPPVSLQMRAGDPTRTTWEDERGHDTVYGWVYPDDRHVIVNGTISTLLQFRHRDYGFTRCTLRFTTPKPFKNFDPASAFGSGLQKVDAWLLAPTSEWSPNGDVWAHAPGRVRLLTRLDLGAGQVKNASEEFDCVQGGWTGIELACSELAGKECMADFWQKESAEPGGVYLEQKEIPN